MWKSPRFRTVCIVFALCAFTAVAHAQWRNDAYRFGQNKVNYETFDWHRITTDHFEIYFYQGEEEIARVTAQMAEDAYDRLVAVLDYTPSAPVPLIVYDSHNDFEQTNATWGLIGESTLGFTEALKNRVVIPFSGSYPQFRHVIHHELTHAFMFDMFYRRGGSISVASQLWWGPPLWFAEGLAEYCSTDWTTEKNMWVRGAVVEGYLNLGGYQAYTAGYSLVRWMADEFGPDKVAAVTRRMATSRNPRTAFTAELGVTLEELQIRWERHLKRFYWPEIDRRELVDEAARRLTEHVRDRHYLNVAPVIAPTGDRIAYLTDRSDYISIYIMSAIDGRILNRVLTGEKSGHFEEMKWTRGGISWSPDGERLAFVAKNRNLDVIYIVDADDGDIADEIRLSQFNSLSFPDWSPDGEKIAFVGVQRGRSDLYVFTLATRQLERLTHDLSDEVSPRWSPDGSRIAFASDRGVDAADSLTIPVNGNRDLYIMDVATRTVTQVTADSTDDTSPSWSPDGTKLAFTSDRNGVYNLYVTNLATGSTRPVTNVLNGVFSPHWSPTGNKVAFSAFTRGGFDIYITNDSLLTSESDTTRGIPEPLIPAAFVERQMEELSRDSTSFFRRPPLSGLRPWAFSLKPEDSTGSPVTFALEEYETFFSPDLVNGMVMANNIDGLLLQMMMLITDTMGDHQVMIYTMVNRNVEDADFELDYVNRQHRINWGISVFQYHQYYLRSLLSPEWTSDRIYGLSATLIRPFSRFTRLELAAELSGQERVSYTTGYQQTTGSDRLPSIKSLVPRVGFVHDNTLWGITGPVNGSRSAFEVKYSPAIDFNTYSYTSAVADWRKYWRFSRDYTIATRVSAGGSFGDNPERFLLGGMNHWINFHYTSSYNVLSDSLASITRFVTPIRGADYGELSGSRFGLVNIEFRYPLVRQITLGWPLPISLRNVQGIIFLDAGTVWGEGRSFKPFRGKGRLNYAVDMTSIDPNDWRPQSIGGYGFGWRLNLGMFILKWDIAWATDLRQTIGSAKQYWSLGTDF